MAKHSFSPDYDQNDVKMFKETLGTFGTTTKPGENQLKELQTKIRQGVKHVELHLASSGKGQFGALDVPDKYGFEQRRTIMQLAKLNKQSLSVHGAFDIVSFSGFDGNSGSFDDSRRYNAMKEIDETIKFAAETAKGGAVVFHIQGEPLSTDRGELHLSKSYLNWLKNKKPNEYENLKKSYFTNNPLNRQFISDPDKFLNVKEEFNHLKKENPTLYNDYIKNSKNPEEAWEKYYVDKLEERRKLSPETQPLVVVGDKLGSVDRKQEIVDLSVLNGTKNFSEKEIEIFNDLDIDLKHFDLNSLQRAQNYFSNGFPSILKGKIDRDEFEKLRSKVLVTYETELKNNNFLQAQADEAFQKKLLDFQINLLELQKKDLNTTKYAYKNYFDKIREIEKEEKQIMSKINLAKEKGDTDEMVKLREKLNGTELTHQERVELNNIIRELQVGNVENKRKEELTRRFQELQRKEKPGLLKEKLSLMTELQGEYQKLEKYDELHSQYNKELRELRSKKNDVKSVTDVIFDKNKTGMAHLGIKALRYQLDLKKKSEEAESELKKIRKNIKELEERYKSTNNSNEKERISNQIQKEKFKTKKLVGLKDYRDIDLINNPLYLAPENMLPGYGSLTSLEEYKAIIRMSQEEFAEKIRSNEAEYKKLREEYEKETGVKIKTKEDAIKLAKRHLAGTFDNAHAGVWLKHFKKEKGESEEHRIERFNKWLNKQAEEMVKEGLVKHVHFNDTLAKDDDHNLLGSGLLDLFDMKERLRKAGIKEALIVEAGGRGATSSGQIMNAFNIFNPNIFYSNQNSNRVDSSVSSGVSDWISVERNYENRPQFSNYGMSYNTFRHVPPRDGRERGNWSGTGFF